jgi:uncharacterized protein YgbK (DUF1537 family)
MTLDSYDLGIVADDLTGACDVAACFAPQIGAVRVAVSLDVESVAGEEVINTQSRLLDGASARELLCRVGSALRSKRVVFKKIDAGLRGPVGAELAGLLEGLQRSGRKWNCVVAPAIPSIGRTTRGGIQYDHGVPIHQGALGHDPHSPPASADIREVIRQTGGGDFRVADAEGPEDLDRIVDAYSTGDAMVFAGSLGLARALAGRVRGHYRKVEMGPPAQLPILVCGSRHAQSARQIELAQRGGVRVLEFDPVLRRFDTAIEHDGKRPRLVRILPDDASKADIQSPSLLASFVEALGLLCEKIHPDGLAVIGGETAFQLLGRMGARRLDVLGHRAEVIARAQISGGVMNGCRWVSKGGSVGPDDAACQMLSLLTSQEAGS